MKEMPAQRSDADCAVREDQTVGPDLQGSARVLIASTRAADGTYEDRTGPLLVDWLRSRGLEGVDKVVVADGPEVGAALRAAVEAGIDVVLTSGGTGISPTDVTPEQTAPLLTREMPGVLEAVRRLGAQKSPTSLLSRGLAGMAGNSFVVNLPGSRGGVRDGIAVLDPILDHLLDQRDGGGHEFDGGQQAGRADGTVSAHNAGEDPARGATPFGAGGAQLQIPEDPEMGQGIDRVRLAEVCEGEVTVARMVDAVTDPRCGAIVTFDGVVRDHDGGRGVERLAYSAHPGAGDVIGEVAREIAERYPDTLVALAHRYGDLEIGDSALTCAVAAPHRKQAFVACDDLVDTVKQRLPIWKHQVFDDGETEWVGALG
ncbi:molybdenum cofactor biosynthesis protein MoaE [Brachybacterium sp. FME24]|uniref:molybdenum cofactor biosynthesis protein MoaE n=1 Tax=Brachybacterium sp. FME24 TaxID=2742605 RepID=UPI001867F334|nr:molybdenum cofactor biosynthesis protein MoaE [Brachybacterium sp. FME24]